MPPTTIYVSPRSLGLQDTLPPAVATVDLVRLFARSPALAGVSLRVEARRSVAVLGPNGAGKTTLLRILATAIRPTFGRAEVDGLDVGRVPDQVRERVAYLSHASGLYDDLTAAENLAFAAALYGLRGAEATDRVAAALESVGLAGVAGQRARSLSAGMRRRLALGRMLLARPSVVLLDEPYAALDAPGAALVDELIVGWRETGASVLVASHAAERLAGFVDGTVRLDAGLVAGVSGAGVSADPPAVTDTLGGQPARARRAAAGTDR